jgi:hypothetical protein
MLPSSRSRTANGCHVTRLGSSIGDPIAKKMESVCTKNMPASHCVAKAKGCDLSRWPSAEKIEKGEGVGVEKSLRHHEITIHVMFLVVAGCSFADRLRGAWLFSTSLIVIWVAYIVRTNSRRNRANG